jgi:hypothetical protein
MDMFDTESVHALFDAFEIACGHPELANYGAPVPALTFEAPRPLLGGAASPMYFAEDAPSLECPEDDATPADYADQFDESSIVVNAVAPQCSIADLVCAAREAAAAEPLGSPMLPCAVFDAPCPAPRPILKRDHGRKLKRAARSAERAQPMKRVRFDVPEPVVHPGRARTVAGIAAELEAAVTTDDARAIIARAMQDVDHMDERDPGERRLNDNELPLGGIWPTSKRAGVIGRDLAFCFDAEGESTLRALVPFAKNAVVTFVDGRLVERDEFAELGRQGQCSRLFEVNGIRVAGMPVPPAIHRIIKDDSEEARELALRLATRVLRGYGGGSFISDGRIGYSDDEWTYLLPTDTQGQPLNNCVLFQPTSRDIIEVKAARDIAAGEILRVTRGKWIVDALNLRDK